MQITDTVIEQEYKQKCTNETNKLVQFFVQTQFSTLPYRRFKYS